LLFHSNDLNHKSKIVGVYGDVKILEPWKTIFYKGFEDNKLNCNITAKKSLSLLFPFPLDSNKYQHNKKLDSQGGYSYQDIDFAEQIIFDEFGVLKQRGIREDEYIKLNDIYFFITGRKLPESFSKDEDEKQQEDFVKEERNKPVEELKEQLNNTISYLPEFVSYHGIRYKRDNLTIARLKIFRGEKCQICNTFIKTRDNKQYVEGAHINPKRKKGTETPNNILILCPNHHKEFDLGNTKIISHDSKNIIFEMNGISYTISLELV